MIFKALLTTAYSRKHILHHKPGGTYIYNYIMLHKILPTLSMCNTFIFSPQFFLSTFCLMLVATNYIAFMTL